jgi:hypothetical protein
LLELLFGTTANVVIEVFAHGLVVDALLLETVELGDRLVIIFHVLNQVLSFGLFGNMVAFVLIKNVFFFFGFGN